MGNRPSTWPRPGCATSLAPRGRPDATQAAQLRRRLIAGEVSDFGQNWMYHADQVLADCRGGVRSGGAAARSSRCGAAAVSPQARAELEL